ncbi:FIST C-terminal domain-containing protein [Sphingomonas sabuli]|uniref:FIST C-terminal domain-containing protein n=1 Tax=Sphingomonas sabuli TaxID=2764186 RepID=A0A7G9L3N9_9SPHN|nr:FIST N-terminal domain-containing protein [Sphingomonas sabuli]QNM83238.1 FIST C-terminal domain-containing protein [Sphingomonas sabuli]
MEAVAASTAEADSAAAGRALAEQIQSTLGSAPDAVIVFAAPDYDHGELLRALDGGCSPDLIVGASSAGEFTNDTLGVGLASALAISAPNARFSLGVGKDLKRDAAAAARSIVNGFAGPSDDSFSYRSALVLTDALAGYADALADELTVATAGEYQFFGGGAGDNATFKRTTVFNGTEVLTDAAVALEILSHKPLGVGVSHGWEPASDPFRVTEAEGLTLISLNGLPAAEAFEEHAAAKGEKLDRASPIPFFLQNILGIDTGSGYRLRVPLAINDDGSVHCAAEIPVGSVVSIMKSSNRSAAEAAERATDAAMAAIGESSPKAALFFDCVATRLRCGDHFASEVAAVTNRIGDAAMVGCNTHGQIARAEGQFEGFHNCTAVVCVFPD